MSLDFSDIIAEKPYDEMGAEFRRVFGQWCNETVLSETTTLPVLAFDLFKKRLALAQKYQTFFAKQVTANGTDELWKKRYSGIGNEPCYSFAMPQLARTYRFFVWCEQMKKESTNAPARYWDITYAKHPELPLGPHVHNEPMKVWAHWYLPVWDARAGGSFECRRMLYANKVWLFEHPRSRWLGQIRMEANTWWTRAAFGENLHLTDRLWSLASFEWLWYWANPFMRAGALTGDALSLVVQKKLGVHIRPIFYHQDCEALLMPHHDYVNKRLNDMLTGFEAKFSM